MPVKTWAWEARQGSDMISIADVLQGIEEYKVEVGYKPARIAVTPDQMDAIKTDKVATQYLDHDKDGRVIIAGVDRKSVVQGKSVDLGGWRSIKK